MIKFRPITDGDHDFLRELYASTREQELATVVDWSAEQKTVFLRQQFDAQHQHYQTYYPEASFDLILNDVEPIGRLYVSRWEREIRLIDIALMPTARGCGTGTQLLQDLLTEGQHTEKVVSIHVECFNPALRLYRRLGFREVGEKGPYLLMEWRPLTGR